MQDIFKKLDLVDYIETFSKLFSREKSIILEGDINLHHRMIKELSNFNFVAPGKVEDLTNALLHIQKQGILKIYDIFEFVKIIRYFLYLKKFNFKSTVKDAKVGEWIDKIDIPTEVLEIENYFKNLGQHDNNRILWMKVATL